MSNRGACIAGVVIFMFAAILPAVAQASGIVTDGEGQSAETIHAHSSNTVTSYEIGAKFECATTHLHLNLTTNNITTAHGSGNGSAFGTNGVLPHAGHCVIAGQLPIHFNSVTVTTVHFEKGGTGTANYAFTSTITHPLIGSIMCNYEGSVHLDWTPTTSNIYLGGAVAGTENVPPCSTTTTISGTFEATDANGLPAVIH